MTAATGLRAQTNEIVSKYTDLWEKGCKNYPAGEGDIQKICPGVEGYQLILTESDLRQTADVVDKNNKAFPLRFYDTITAAFSFLGKKAEWRLKKVDGKLKPIALIIRVNAQESGEDSKKITSYLAVAKISPGEICVVGKVPPQEKQNEAARQLADGAGQKKCLSGASR